LRNTEENLRRPAAKILFVEIPPRFGVFMMCKRKMIGREAEDEDVKARLPGMFLRCRGYEILTSR